MTNHKESRTYAVVAYITILGTLIAYFMNQEAKNNLTSFHVRQGLGLWLMYFVLGYIVSGFDSWMLTYTFWIFFSVLFVYGIAGAINGKTNAIPLLGDFFQRLFKNLS